MVENNKTGIIIEPQSTKAIIDAILTLYNDRNLLDEMSVNIQNTYFSGAKSWKASADKFIEACKNIKTKN